MAAFQWKWFALTVAGLCSMLLLAGCEGWSGSISLGKSEAQTENDDDLDLDLDSKEWEPKETVSEESLANEGSQVVPVAHIDSDDFAHKVDQAGPERLKLNLNVGEKFPILKSVTQTVLQQGSEGDRRSKSVLDLSIALSVREHPGSGAHAGDYLFDVKYLKVKYEQDLLGQKLVFDSGNREAQVPPELRTYQQLIGNGFSFWLKADNQISELVGFDEFLNRCLDGTPRGLQGETGNLLANATGTEGLANFVDDSIGLLPPTAIRLGDSWTVNRQVLQPISMKISSRYSLTGMDETNAEVSILGQISPIASVSADAQNIPIQVVVEGGQTFGSCTIDRRTGLPVHSQVNQEISMRVKMADRPEFRQRKQSITTIRAYAPQGPTAEMELQETSSETGLQLTSGSGSANREVRQAGGSIPTDVGKRQQADYQNVDPN